jgi:Cu/Ag efflux pump CusA
MPPLDEGDLLFMPVTDTSVSLPQALEITRRQDQYHQRVPGGRVGGRQTGARRDLDRSLARPT